MKADWPYRPASARDEPARPHGRRAARCEILLRAAGRLASSLDGVVLAARGARLGVPELGDCCLIDLVDGHGHLERAAAAHVDPVKESLLSATKGLGVAAQMLPRARTSWLCVPLADRGRKLGAMTFLFEGSGRVYGREERATARRLARLVARALGNARLYREARSEVSARDDLLAAVSHDLRTPLSRIYLTTDLLEAAAIPEQRPHLELLRRSARTMNRMIQDLMDLRRCEERGLLLDRSREVLGDVVREAVEMLGTPAGGAPVRIALDFAPDLPRLMVDRRRLVQALSNLLENAAKSRPAGLEITIRGEVQRGDVLLSVRDNGCGISLVDLPHVFDRYWQARKSDHRGLGLGLAIARAVAEAHGGTLSAKSEIGVGTTFTMTLPVDCSRDNRPLAGRREPVVEALLCHQARSA